MRFFIRLTPPDPNPNSIQELEWVRRIGGKGVGIVESVTNYIALVDWLTGKKEPVPCTELELVKQRDYGKRRPK